MPDRSQVKATSIVKRLTEILAESRAETERWIAALRSEEAAAAVAPDASIHLYEINYRVADDKSRTKGGGASRRSTLITLIRSLKGREKHQSTSTWLAGLHIPSAQTLLKLLGRPLDAELDYLHVREVTDNSASLGNADLQS